MGGCQKTSEISALTTLDVIVQLSSLCKDINSRGVVGTDRLSKAVLAGFKHECLANKLGSH
jgi:hypothetical protein